MKNVILLVTDNILNESWSVSSYGANGTENVHFAVLNYLFHGVVGCTVNAGS